METVKGPDSMERKLESLVDQFQLPLLRLCFAYLHDEELAKDAVQDTFIKVYRHLPEFQNASSEQTWVFRIAINVCKDMKKTPWFRHVDQSVTLDMLPEPIAANNDNERELTVQIMQLPPKLREVALLCWFQGMTYESAAETLGISFQAVGSRLNRARKKLREYLEGSETDVIER